MPTNYKRTEASEELLEKIRTFINEKGGIVKMEQFAELNIDYRRILDYLDKGELERIKNGYYTDCL